MLFFKVTPGDAFGVRAADDRKVQTLAGTLTMRVARKCCAASPISRNASGQGPPVGPGFRGVFANRETPKQCFQMLRSGSWDRAGNSCANCAFATTAVRYYGLTPAATSVHASTWGNSLPERLPWQSSWPACAGSAKCRGKSCCAISAPGPSRWQSNPPRLRVRAPRPAAGRAVRPARQPPARGNGGHFPGSAFTTEAS